VELVAGALVELGVERALVVHGRDGQDELSLTGVTEVIEVRGDEVARRRVIPEDAGLKRCAAAELAGGDAQTNARLVRAVLGGASGPRTDAVLFNAAGALVAAGLAEDLGAGVEQARAAVGDGRGTRLLRELAAATQDLAAASGVGGES
jgi:anthranilate phosphoribosyltransferase